VSARLAYRIAAILLVLFAALHTVGFLNFKPPTAEGLAVWESMNRVHFAVRSSEFSYRGFYVGFGLFVTTYMLFAAYLAWWLSGAKGGVGGLGWAFCGVQVVSLVLSCVYFSVPQAAFSGGLAVLLGWAASRPAAVIVPSR
jgi:hypothetical protein